MAAVINIGGCTSSEEESTPEAPVKLEKENKRNSSDSSDLEDTPLVRRKPKQRTARGVAALLQAHKNQTTSEEEDKKPEEEGGVYSNRVSTFWNKVRSGNLNLDKFAQQHTKDPSDDDDDDSFNEKKKHTGKPKSRLGKAGREKAKKKKSPEKKRTSTRQKHSQEVVELDSDDESQNDSILLRDRSPTPPPEPPSDLPKKKPRMARGCRQALNRLKSLSDKLQKGQFTVEDDDDDCVVVEAATPDAEKEVLVKVKSRSGIQKFPMKKKESFYRIMEEIAAHEEVPLDCVMFLHNEEMVHSYDSPISINLRIADILDCHIQRGNVESTDADTENEDPDSIEITLQGKEPKSRRTLKITKTQPFEKIMREYAQKMNASYERLTFQFDGAPLQPRETPSHHDMEGDECIDVIGL